VVTPQFDGPEAEEQASEWEDGHIVGPRTLECPGK